MPAADQMLLDHPINVLGGDLRAALDELSGEVRDGLENEHPGWIAQVGAAADWADGLAGLLDPRLVPFPTLDAVTSQLRQALGYIPEASGNPASATQVLSFIGNAVTQAGGLTMATAPLPELADAIGKKLGRAVSLRATALTRDLQQIDGELATLRESVVRARDDATTADTQRVAEQSQRLDELARAIDAERTRVDSFVTTGVTENQQAETTRQKTHTDALAAQRDAFEKLKASLDTEGEDLIKGIQEAAEKQRGDADMRLGELVDKLDQQASGVLDHLRQVKREVDELYEVVVKKGLSGEFAAEATVQSKAANAWRWIALTLGALAIAVALVTALQHPDDLKWEGLVAKLAVSALLGGLATYAGKQSGLHRGREAVAKELALDLAAIGPFLNQLPEDQRVEAIQAFTQRWMTSRAIAGPDGGGSPLLATQIIEGLAKALGGGKGT